MDRQNWIHEAGLAVFNYGIQRRSKDAGDLGVRLCLISNALNNADWGGNAEDIPELQEVIRDLEAIFKCSSWPSEPDHSQRARRNIEGFLAKPNNNRARNLVDKTCRLLQKLQAYETPVRMAGDSPKQAQREYPDHVKKKLLLGLQSQSHCLGCKNGTASRNRSQWHPTRLLLNQGLLDDQDSACFDIIVSSDPDNIWQDISMRIPLETKRVLRFADETSSPALGGHKPEAGGFCRLFSSPTFARICFDYGDGHFVRLPDGFALQQRPCPGVGISLSVVLEQYALEVKDKISLAYILASSFWQFYDTQILLHEWTSNSIFFMPEEVGHTRRLPNKAYISIHFDSRRERTDEYLDLDFLVHRFPRILSFAIILLEVGLGKSLRLQKFDSPVTRLNSYFEIASQALIELQETPWPNFSNKNTYIKAIENCLESAQYRIQQTANASTDTATVDQRRRIFYQKVVWPLEWLAEIGFRGSYNKNTVLSERKRTVPSNMPPPSPNNKQLASMPSFHAGTRIEAHNWLDHLKQINQHIHHTTLQQPISSKRIRVAILDTGYDPSAPIFQSRARSSRIKGWKDFVWASNLPVDTFGHGTFMATLVIESAPIAELCIARVAESTDKLPQSSLQIENAIRWAAIEQEADVISMSFGFPGADEGIAKVIDEVRSYREGKIIFLASAGNFGPYQDDTFPASHPAVIALRATTSLGTFLDTNPLNINDDSAVFGTYGDDIPPRLREYQPLVCQPGTSAATAIAGGVTAMILAYVTILPSLVTLKDKAGLLSRAWTTEGMQKIFHRMSGDMGNRKRFVNPIKFFLDKPTDLARYCAIYDSLQGI